MTDKAFGEMLEGMMSRLLRVARRMAPAGVDAQDLVQDTVERAWRARSELRDEGAAAAWLRHIMVNRLRDIARRQGLISFQQFDDEQPPTPDLCIDDPPAVIARAQSDRAESGPAPTARR